jgi:hypothetical protein
MSQHNHRHPEKDLFLRPRRWGGTVALGSIALAALTFACESATEPLPSGEEAAPDLPHTVLQGLPEHASPLLERAWSGDRMWEMLKPRPPGLGTPEGQTVPFYVLAPVIAGDPLSPPAEIPGVLRVGGRDHVVPTPAGNQASFRAVARTVALQHPGWEPAPPFGPAQCDEVVHDDRIAWAWVEVAGLTEGVGHPCGRIAAVFAVQLDGESCPMPITNLERVHEAIAQGLVNDARPPEPAWPVAIRPMTQPGTGGTAPVAPGDCVPGGARVGG